MRLLNFGLALIACFSQCYSYSDKVPTVAVMPFSSRTVDIDALEGIGSALSTALLNTSKIRVMERDQMQQILREQSFQNSGLCDSGECAIEIGKLLSVDQIIVGSISKVGATYSVTARQVKVETGEVLRSVTHNSRAEVDAILTDIVPILAKELLEQQVLDNGKAVELQSLRNDSSKTSTGKTELGRKKSSILPWVLGGSVIAGGGVAVFLLTQEQTTGHITSKENESGSWSTTVRWK